MNNEELIKKLFGDMGGGLTDTYSEDWKDRDMGLIGRIDGRLTELERKFDKLIRSERGDEKCLE